MEGTKAEVETRIPELRSFSLFLVESKLKSVGGKENARLPAAPKLKKDEA